MCPASRIPSWENIESNLWVLQSQHGSQTNGTWLIASRAILCRYPEAQRKNWQCSGSKQGFWFGTKSSKACTQPSRNNRGSLPLFHLLVAKVAYPHLQYTSSSPLQRIVPSIWFWQWGTKNIASNFCSFSLLSLFWLFASFQDIEPTPPSPANYHRSGPIPSLGSQAPSLAVFMRMPARDETQLVMSQKRKAPVTTGSNTTSRKTRSKKSGLPTKVWNLSFF